MTQKIDLREVVAFLRTLPEDADVPEAAAERFPDLSVADLKRATAIARAQQEDEDAAEREDEEETQRLERIAARAKPPKGELVRDPLSSCRRRR